jgi:hypothetical protein
MNGWLNKWIVPLLIALIILAALSIAAFVGFGVHLLRKKILPAKSGDILVRGRHKISQRVPI